MTILSASELTQIKRDVQEIVEDTSINLTAKYRQYVGTEYYNAETQQYNDPYTDWSGVSMLQGMVTNREVDARKNIQLGDTKFVLMQSAVSGTLSSQDLVVASGVTYNIKKIGYDPLGIVYLLYVEMILSG